MKKITLFLVCALMTAALAGCGGAPAQNTAPGTQAPATQAPAIKGVTVVSREDGSGTRGAFIELFGVEVKNADGKKEDMTTEMAEITNSTSVMLTTVAGNKNAIGYVSLGSLNDSVKALKIEGVEATAQKVKDGSYPIARPFNIVTKGELGEAASDFIAFIMSAEGQEIAEAKGYVSVGEAPAYEGGISEGKITVAGSSSVTPLMEALKEGYIAKNSGVSIEIQQSDSTTGVTSVLEGICDIGMASRELKDSETQAGAQPTVIAMDGIAVIVNLQNPVADMTRDQVRAIFIGEVEEFPS